MDVSERLTIGITTRDRWAELQVTVEKLVTLGLDSIPAIVIDDGSVAAEAEQVCKLLRKCTIIREPVSLGLVEERNHIARLTKTDYLVSLDDDSCFDSPHNLDKAVEYMDANPDVAVLAFWITRTHGKPRSKKTCDDIKPLSPIPARHYNGCGHLLRVRAFHELGEYRGYFHRMCEEKDLSLRVYGAGQRVVLFADITVVHRLAPTAHSIPPDSFYIARNTLLCWLLNLPAPLCLWRCGRTVLGQIVAALQRRQLCWPTLKGLASSFAVFGRHRHDREPLSPSLLREYFSL